MLQDNEFGRCPLRPGELTLQFSMVFSLIRRSNSKMTSAHLILKAWDAKHLHLSGMEMLNRNTAFSSREDLTVHVSSQGPDYSRIRDLSTDIS
jgi:hypothetical protein